eukprot:6196469-Pleurochrysis_carterae.AAC.1
MQAMQGEMDGIGLKGGSSAVGRVLKKLLPSPMMDKAASEIAIKYCEPKSDDSRKGDVVQSSAKPEVEGHAAKYADIETEEERLVAEAGAFTSPYFIDPDDDIVDEGTDTDGGVFEEDNMEECSQAPDAKDGGKTSLKKAEELTGPVGLKRLDTFSSFEQSVNVASVSSIMPSPLPMASPRTFNVLLPEVAEALAMADDLSSAGGARSCEQSRQPACPAPTAMRCTASPRQASPAAVLRACSSAAAMRRVDTMDFLQFPFGAKTPSREKPADLEGAAEKRFRTDETREDETSTGSISKIAPTAVSEKP